MKRGGQTVRSKLALDVATALDLIIAAGEADDGFRVGDVLFDQDALGEGVRIV
jgi:hypothetical protein